MKVYKGLSGEFLKELKQNSAFKTEVFRFFFYYSFIIDKNIKI